MGEKENYNNKVKLVGIIESGFKFSHEAYGGGFYIAKLAVKRMSGTEDIIPIMVSNSLVDVNMDWTGKKVKVEGQFRSFNKHEDDGNHLILSVFARSFEEILEIPFSEDENNIFLSGTICKEPVYRETPKGRKITDIMLSVNRTYGKCDYIPCVCWGADAMLIKDLDVGTDMSIVGRIQSREYEKSISKNESIKKVAYEVSISEIKSI